MRREQQELQSRIEAAEAEKQALREHINELGEAVSAKAEGQQAFDQQIAALTEERDNLLHLRDQLTSRVAASGEDSGDSAIEDQLEDLRATVGRLTEQREQLALDLSDARTELESVRVGVPQIQDTAEQTTASRWRQQSDLLAGVLHDLQPQMASISDYIELLLTESIGILGAAQQQVLRMLAGDIGHLAEMINEAQGAAQPEAANFTLRHEDVDVVSVVEDVLQERSAQLNDGELMLELSLDDHLPPVNIDRDNLKQFITQLLENACTVSPPGSQIGIAVSAGPIVLPDASEAVEAIEIAIRDHGGGIAQAVRVELPGNAADVDAVDWSQRDPDRGRRGIDRQRTGEMVFESPLQE
jgi:signal transduction histidine kinase